MFRSANLRTKALTLILPVVVGAVVVSGFASASSARAALLQIATRLIAFKAEQVRDFAYSQWEILEDLEYADDRLYRRAGEAAIQSFAGSLIRSPTERIFALDSAGRVVMSTALIDISESERATLIEHGASGGWFESTIGGIRVVGQGFGFDPLDWRIMVTESSDAFYQDVRRITGTHGLILVGAVIVAVASLLVFVAQMLAPLERLTDAMREVSAGLDLDRRVAIESHDEVGILAHEFNAMIATVQVSYERLQKVAAAEATARRAAAEREEETLRVLGAATEFRDTETGAHILRVGRMSEMLAQLHGEDTEFCRLLLKASPLHDVGKIGISDRILLKPGKLTRKEFETIKEHTTIGWRILGEARSIHLRAGAEIALTHHERWDGNGYPTGSAGTATPLAGRIVAICDVYDAIRSERPYKRPQPHDQAVELIRAGRATQFDPDIVDIFLARERDVEAIYTNTTDRSATESTPPFPESHPDERR